MANYIPRGKESRSGPEVALFIPPPSLLLGGAKKTHGNNRTNSRKKGRTTSKHTMLGRKDRSPSNEKRGERGKIESTNIC